MHAYDSQIHSLLYDRPISAAMAFIKSDGYDVSNQKYRGLSGQSKGLNGELKCSYYCSDPTFLRCGEQMDDLSLPHPHSFDVS